MRRAARVAARQKRCLTGRNGNDREYSEAELNEKRKLWARMSEADRTRNEWMMGDPYYMPSFGVFENFSEYEEKYKALLMSTKELAALSSEYYAADLDVSLATRKDVAQQQLMREVEKNRKPYEWNEQVRGTDWIERLQRQQDEFERKLTGDPPAADDQDEAQKAKAAAAVASRITSIPEPFGKRRP